MDWTAAWIWHPRTNNMDNFYLYARKRLRLPAAMPKACVFVTAGSLYKLFVNGQYVGRGPNPSDPSRYYYDVYEVGALLRAGDNCLAALCYNYGPQSHGILGQNWGRGGFLCELRADRDGEVLAATDASWKVQQALAWDQAASINCTLYGDYKETYDSRREIAGWMEAACDDAGWLAPEVLGRPPVEPYTQLVEREIPFLGGERVCPVAAHWESASVTYAWRNDWEVYHEQRLVPGSPWFGGGKYVEIQKTHADFAPSLLLDFGRDVTGYPEIAIHSGSGGIIDVLYGENLSLVRVDRFILKGGPQVLQPFNRRTFRYMKLLFPEVPARIEIDTVSMEMNTYPVEYRGSFACSDAKLTRVWDVGRYTVHLSMLDHFVDCPWRERTIYGGDIYNENLIAQYAFGDGRMNRKVLRQMFAIQYPEGPLPPYGPYRGCDGFYPSWSAFTGLAFVDHYQLTGDREFVNELWPGFRRLLDWTVEETGRNKPNLIGDPAKGGKFDVWKQGERVRFAPWNNFPFYLLLQRGAQLARALGKEDEFGCWAAAAQRMGAALKEHMVDENGLATPHPRASDARTQADAAYLLWSELPDRKLGRVVAEKMLGVGVSPIDTPFQGLFLAEGLFNYGEEDKAIGFIRDYWGEMLDRGASLCHGWSAGATYSLMAHVLGVRPLEPGFAKVLIEPCPGELTWAAGDVPTPRGTVRVKWTRSESEFRLDTTLPEAPATVALPSRNPHARVLLNGSNVATQRRGERVIFEIGPGEHEIVLK
jgi:hypothetical protein